MAEAVPEKRSCPKCGAEVREGTTFCYACGGKVAAEETNGAPDVDEKTQAALDDLADKLRGDDRADEGEEKLAKAAAERKKARVSQRKSREFVWEPRDEVPQGLLIATAAVFVLAVFVVVVLVVWK